MEHSDSRPVLLTRQEAADILRVSVATLSRLTTTGQIHGVHVGRALRIPRAEVERVIAGDPPPERAGMRAVDLGTWPPTPSMLGEDDDEQQQQADDRAAVEAAEKAAIMRAMTTPTYGQHEHDASRTAEQHAAHSDTYGTPHPDDH